MAAGQIDDAQSTMTESYARPHENAAIIRTSMDHRLIHFMNEFPGDVCLALVFEDAANAAHGFSQICLFLVSTHPNSVRGFPGQRPQLPSTSQVLGTGRSPQSAEYRIRCHGH